MGDVPPVCCLGGLTALGDRGPPRSVRCGRVGPLGTGASLGCCRGWGCARHGWHVRGERLTVNGGGAGPLVRLAGDAASGAGAWARTASAFRGVRWGLMGRAAILTMATAAWRTATAAEWRRRGCGGLMGLFCWFLTVGVRTWAWSRPARCSWNGGGGKRALMGEVRGGTPPSWFCRRSYAREPPRRSKTNAPAPQTWGAKAQGGVSR